MFSGIDAPKHAWQLICSACVELWGFSPGIVFDFSAEASVCVKKKLAIVTIIKYKFQVAMPASVSEVEKKRTVNRCCCAGSQIIAFLARSRT